jgi:hypothetical protein
MPDTTPRNHLPDQPENAPPWFLILIVLIIAFGGTWLLLSLFGWGRAL